MPIVESALGIENAFSIARASPQIVALTIGLEDYTTDLGVVKTPAGNESLYARQLVINAARAAEVQAIDSVFGDVADLEGLRAWALNSCALGFEGMGCVPPTQIPVIHEAFAPSAGRDRARAQDCGCIRRSTGKGSRRSKPRLEDDRSTGRKTRCEGDGARQGYGPGS